ncbi:MAG: PrsW family intramembrane metalloprotease [Candidatus Aminicenantes bacterium]|nr:PrsW family intramembrane metalloprotease [Candidatus Aminicenantes bacterium]
MRTGILNILFLLGFLLLMFAVGSRVLIGGDGSLKFILLALIVLVPSSTCVLFYYLQDRREPEPVEYIVYAFLAGMAAASLGLIPLWELFYRIQDWIYVSSRSFLQGTFLVIAPLAAASLYAVVRYVFYPLKEFDEPVDGMVYGAVTGVGLAFVITIHHLATRPDCTMFVIASVATSYTLIYSAVGSLIGYLLGQVKFRRKNLEAYALFSLLLGTLLLGLFYLMNNFIFLEAFASAFFLSFGLGLVYALIVLAYGTWQMRRLTEAGRHAEIVVCRRFDRLPILLIVLFLVGAVFVSARGLRGQRFEIPEYGIHFHFPNSFSAFPFEDVFASKVVSIEPMQMLFSCRGPEDLPVNISIRTHPLDSKPELFDVVRYVEAAETESLSTRIISIGGKRGTRVAYSYLVEAQELNQVFPRLMQVYCDVIVRGDSALVFTFRAGAGYFEQGLSEYANILKNLRWEDE